MTDRYAETDTWPNPPASQQPAPAATERDFPCCDAPREGSDDAEARVAAYAEAIGGEQFTNRIIRAVMAVADAEQEEVAHRGRAARMEAERRADAAERARNAALAEVTELRDRLGRVEALAGDHQQPGAWIAQPDGSHKWMTQLRAALDGYRIVWRPLPDGYVLEPLAALAVPVTGDARDASPAEAKCPTCGGARDDRRPAEGQALCPESFHFRTLASPSAKDAARPRRYDQCDETCTTDCGHCKGAASPTEQATEGGA